MRERVLALICLRHGVPAVQGRGVDSLPRDVTGALTETLVRTVDVAELRRAFAVVTDTLLRETTLVDRELAARLCGPLKELAS